MATTVNDEIKELKTRLDDLEKRIVRLETTWNTLKTEVDDLAKILDRMLGLAVSQKKLIEQMNKIIASVHKLATVIEKKKGIWWG